MDNYDTKQWTDSFVMRNERECVEILEMFTAAMRKSLRAGDYIASIQCCDRICYGLELMCNNIGFNEYLPKLYTYSYIMGEIALFGLGGEKGKEIAKPCFEDAYDFAVKCETLAPRFSTRAKSDLKKIDKILLELKRGTRPLTIKMLCCPDFPKDILNN